MSLALELLLMLTSAGSTVVVFTRLLRLSPAKLTNSNWHYIISKMAILFYLFPVALMLKWIMPIFSKTQTIHMPTLPINMFHEASVNNEKMWISSQMIPIEAAWAFFILWGTGALGFAFWQIYCYRRFMRNIKNTAIPILKDSEASNQLFSLKQKLKVKGPVQLAYSTKIKSPVLVGLLKPTIVLPLDDTLEMDLGMVFHHELIHLQRKDLWVKMLALAAGAIHWFNPLVHLLRKDIHLWSELSCDEEVVKNMSHAERKRYGQMILNIMIGSRGLPVKFCSSLSGDGKELKRRLSMMLKVKKLKKQTIFMTAKLTLLIGVISTSTAVWAANGAPDVEPVPQGQMSAQEKKGASSISSSTVAYDYTFTALTPEQQKFVTKEMARYYLDEQGNVVHFTDIIMPSVPFIALNSEQQQQATKEIGHYSLEKVREMMNQ